MSELTKTLACIPRTGLADHLAASVESIWFELQRESKREGPGFVRHKWRFGVMSVIQSKDCSLEAAYKQIPTHSIHPLH